MAATVDRLEAEKDSITGVVITLGQEDVLRRRRPQRPQEGPQGGRRRGRADGARAQAAAAAPGDARQAGRRRHQRRGARRRARDRPRRAPPRSRSTTPRSSSASRRSSSACCRAAAASPARVRMFGIANALLQLLLQGQRLPAGQGARAGPGRRGRRRRATISCPAAKKWIAANPEAVQPWDVKGHKIPGGTPSNPKFAANLPAFPANLRKTDQGRQLPGAAPHHGRGGRGRAGRLRHRDRDRGPLLHGPRHRPGGEEHDPGVLLRPAGRAGLARAAGGRSSRRRSRRSSCSARA